MNPLDNMTWEERFNVCFQALLEEQKKTRRAEAWVAKVLPTMNLVQRYVDRVLERGRPSRKQRRYVAKIKQMYK